MVYIYICVCVLFVPHAGFGQSSFPQRQVGGKISEKFDMVCCPNS